MNKQEQFLVKFGIAWFLLTHILMILSDLNMDDYDWSSDLLVNKQIQEKSMIWKYLKHTTRWDAVFYIEIALDGYKFEKNHAFFPFFPKLLSIISNQICIIIHIEKIEAILLTNIILQGIMYLGSIILMYRFSYKSLKSYQKAFVSTIFLCINPASAHFNAIYTETIYTFCLLITCYLFTSQYLKQQGFLINNRFSGYAFAIPSIITCFITTQIRSNGIFLILHIGYPLLQRFIIDLINFKQRYAIDFIKEILTGLTIIILLLSGQIITLYEPYQNYCINGQFKDNPAPWCKSTVPNIYPFLQVNHWQCGLFTGILRVYYQFWIGILPCIIMLMGVIYFLKINKENINKNGISLLQNIPLYIYSFIFFLICFFYAAIDSSNRFFSHNPFYYWFLAELILDEENQFKEKQTKYVFTYVITYYAIGVLKFSNFMIWT